MQLRCFELPGLGAELDQNGPLRSLHCLLLPHCPSTYREHFTNPCSHINGIVQRRVAPAVWHLQWRKGSYRHVMTFALEICVDVIPHNIEKLYNKSTFFLGSIRKVHGIGKGVTKRWELRKDRKLTSSNPVKGRTAPRLCRVLWKSENFHLHRSVPTT